MIICIIVISFMVKCLGIKLINYVLLLLSINRIEKKLEELHIEMGELCET